jgi:hypothetical protein
MNRKEWYAMLFSQIDIGSRVLRLELGLGRVYQFRPLSDFMLLLLTSRTDMAMASGNPEAGG